MEVARARRPRVATRSLPGASRRWATAPVRKARIRTATSCADGEEVKASDESINQEGPVRAGASDDADRGDELLGREADAAHLVADVHDLSRDGRAHDRGTRRPQACARVRLGVDG